MPTRNVVLTEHHQKTIDRLVRSGRYQNASEVLREGLRLVEQREREDAAKLRILREAVQAGLDDLEAGRVIEVREEDLDSYIAAALPRARKKKA
jgi:antitoxin ParD1/3/4